jgi:hypothetical protein
MRGCCSWSQCCGGAQSRAMPGATRCYVVDQEDMGGALAKIAEPPYGGRCRGRKGMACDVGVTRVEMADLDRAQLIVAIAKLVRGAHQTANTAACPPIHRRAGGFLAAFGMRSGQLTMRSSRSSSATSSSHAPTRPRTEIPA